MSSKRGKLHRSPIKYVAGQKLEVVRSNRSATGLTACGQFKSLQKHYNDEITYTDEEEEQTPRASEKRSPEGLDVCTPSAARDKFRILENESNSNSQNETRKSGLRRFEKVDVAFKNLFGNSAAECNVISVPDDNNAVINNPLDSSKDTLPCVRVSDNTDAENMTYMKSLRNTRNDISLLKNEASSELSQNDSIQNGSNRSMKSNEDNKMTEDEIMKALSGSWGFHVGKSPDTSLLSPRTNPSTPTKSPGTPHLRKPLKERMQEVDASSIASPSSILRKLRNRELKKANNIPVKSVKKHTANKVNDKNEHLVNQPQRRSRRRGSPDKGTYTRHVEDDEVDQSTGSIVLEDRILALNQQKNKTKNINTHTNNGPCNEEHITKVRTNISQATKEAAFNNTEKVIKHVLSSADQIQAKHTPREILSKIKMNRQDSKRSEFRKNSLRSQSVEIPIAVKRLTTRTQNSEIKQSAIKKNYKNKLPILQSNLTPEQYTSQGNHSSITRKRQSIGEQLVICDISIGEDDDDLHCCVDEQELKVDKDDPSEPKIKRRRCSSPFVDMIEEKADNVCSDDRYFSIFWVTGSLW